MIKVIILANAIILWRCAVLYFPSSILIVIYVRGCMCARVCVCVSERGRITYHAIFAINKERLIEHYRSNKYDVDNTTELRFIVFFLNRT